VEAGCCRSDPAQRHRDGALATETGRAAMPGHWAAHHLPAADEPAPPQSLLAAIQRRQQPCFEPVQRPRQRQRAAQNANSLQSRCKTFAYGRFDPARTRGTAAAGADTPCCLSTAGAALLRRAPPIFWYAGGRWLTQQLPVAACRGDARPAWAWGWPKKLGISPPTCGMELAIKPGA